MLLFRIGLSAADQKFEGEPVYELKPEDMRIMSADAPPVRIPAAVSLIDKETIQAGSAQLSINEALETVPGVFALNPYNYAQDSRLAIRGFGARSDFGIRGVRVVVDGIPATLPDGQAGVDGIDLGSAGRMEIVRGPASAIYGPASGGVLLIETEEPPAAPFAETRVTAGSYGLFKGQFKAGAAHGPLSMLVNATYLDYEGYRENSQTINRSLNAKLRYRFDNAAELTTVINVIDYPRQDDPGGLTEAEVAEDPRQARDRNLQFDSGESVRQEKMGVTYRRPLVDESEFRVHGFVVQRDFANKLPFAGGGQVQFDRLYYGVGASYRYRLEPLEVVAGIEGGQQVDDRQNFDNLDGSRGPLALEQREKVRNLGSYLRAELNMPGDVTLSGAVRLDEVRFDVEDGFLADGDDSGDVRFEHVSPMLGLLWQPTAELSVYGNVASSFETPTTTEFDNPSGGGFNNSLKAQTAVNYEVGVKGSVPEIPGRPRFELALFTINVEDALVPFELAAFPDREFYRNAGSSTRTGLETAVEITPVEQWFARVSYTYSNFRYDDFVTPDGDFSGNRLPGVPAHFANVRLGYRAESGIALTWNTRLVGPLEADDANLTELEGYTVSDLRLRWERTFADWTLEAFAGLNNIFDAAYPGNVRINAFGGRFYEPAPERNLYGGIRLRREFGQ